jgi:ATP-dependent Clp protease protease subunit
MMNIRNAAPYVLEKTASGERVWDIWSILNRNRVVFLGDEVSSYSANLIIAQLLYLESESDEPIQFLINSPGGDCTAGLAILDTMHYIHSKVSTMCLGMAASMAAILLAAGEKGMRFSLPHSTIMIHQVKSGMDGTLADIRIAAKHVERTNDIIADILAEDTGHSRDEILLDIDRDNWMNPSQAKEYGIIDDITFRKGGA